MDDKKETLFQKATPLPASLNPQIVYAWKAPLRAYKKRSGSVLRFYLAVALLLSAIVFFLGDKILIIPIWSILFLFYVLTITPPPEVENRITKFGIETAGITLRWEALSYFYFNNRFGFTILTIVTHPPYNMHAYLVVPKDSTKLDLIKILAEHIVYQDKPELTFIDRVIKALSSLVPDDEEEESIPATIKIEVSDQKHQGPMGEIKDTLASFFQKPERTSPSPQSSETMR